jgi:hypothetical protein
VEEGGLWPAVAYPVAARLRGSDPIILGVLHFDSELWFVCPLFIDVAAGPTAL